MKRVIAGLALVAWALPAHANYEAAAEYSASLRGISFLVIENGEVVYEDYPNEGAIDRAHPLASGTKSFIGIMAAAAVQDGILSLDERVSDTITEWQGSPRQAITVRQLLNQTDGLRRPQRAGAQIRYSAMASVRLEHRPGEVFVYGSTPFQVFGELMRRKLDGDPVGYLTRRVLDPIGLEVTVWRRSDEGNPFLSAGAHLTARNWARLGEFLLARGYWNGEPLVSPLAFDELFLGSSANPTYGLSWWLNEPVDPVFAAETPPLSNASDFWQHPEDLPEDLVFAAGLGHQRMFVSWQRNMVVVRQAEGIRGALLGQRLSWSDAEFWRLLGGPEDGNVSAPVTEYVSLRTNEEASEQVVEYVTLRADEATNVEESDQVIEQLRLQPMEELSEEISEPVSTALAVQVSEELDEQEIVSLVIDLGEIRPAFRPEMDQPPEPAGEEEDDFVGPRL